MFAPALTAIAVFAFAAAGAGEAARLPPAPPAPPSLNASPPRPPTTPKTSAAKANSPASGDEAVWNRPIRLAFWGDTVEAAVREFSLQADIHLMIGRSLAAVDGFNERPLYLLADGVPVRTALELIARALDCRYYLAEPGRVHLTAGYDWMRDAEAPRTLIRQNPRHDWLLPGDDPENADRRLRELAKAVPVLDNPVCNFRIVRMPVGGADSTRIQLEAALPPTLHRLVTSALELASEPPPPLPQAAALPPAPPPDPTPERLAVPVDARYDQRPAREIVGDLALQTGLVIAFDHEPFRQTPPPQAISLKPGLVSAREALVELSRLMGLGGAYSPAERVVWLGADARGWSDAPVESRELLWHSLRAGVYPVAPALAGFDPAAANVPGGDDLVERLRRSVHPRVWLDPSAALVFNPRHRGLVVIAPPDTHAAVGRELIRLAEALRRDGRWPQEKTP